MEILENKKLLKKYISSEVFHTYFDDYIAKYVELLRYDENEHIISQNISSSYLFLLMQGRANVRTILANGKSVIINTLKAPTLIGEIELIRNISPFTVQALEDCYVLAIPLNICHDYLLNDAHFLYAVSYNLADKERKETLHMLRTFGYPLENRLAYFILENRQGNHFYIKKVTIAESLGVSYRHIEKVMNDFVVKNYLVKEKLVYEIKNEDALIQLSEGLE